MANVKFWDEIVFEELTTECEGRIGERGAKNEGPEDIGSYK